LHEFFNDYVALYFNLGDYDGQIKVIGNRINRDNQKSKSTFCILLEGRQTCRRSRSKFLFDVKEEAVRIFSCERVFKSKHSVIKSDNINTGASATQ
jgi:hypothetical protein